MPSFRPSFCFLAVVSAGCLALVLAFVHGSIRQRQERPRQEALARLARDLSVTDLALFTEARYTRHPSQTDLHSPFQEHPAALDHFPSGSLVPPPRFSP